MHNECTKNTECTMILSKCVVCGRDKAKGLLSNLGIRTPLDKLPLLGDILF